MEKHPQVGKVNEFTHQTEYTLLLYLNGGGEAGAATDTSGGESIFSMEPLKGGETNFFAGSTGSKLTCSFAPLAGWALFHGHGDRCMIHEGGLVRAGVKYVLRTDVLFEVPAS